MWEKGLHGLDPLCVFYHSTCSFIHILLILHTTTYTILAQNHLHPIFNMKSTIITALIGSTAAFAPVQTGKASTLLHYFEDKLGAQTHPTWDHQSTSGTGYKNRNVTQLRCARGLTTIDFFARVYCKRMA